MDTNVNLYGIPVLVRDLTFNYLAGFKLNDLSQG